MADATTSALHDVVLKSTIFDLGAAPRSCPLLSRSLSSGSSGDASNGPRVLLIGVLGTSISYGAELPKRRKGWDGPHRHSWPTVLSSLFKAIGYPHVRVLNGATRASSADQATLCFEHLWSSSWSGGWTSSAPPLDLAVIEYTWTSHVSQVEALVQLLHGKRIPTIALLYRHPANPFRFGVANDTTPWKKAENVGHLSQFASLFRRYSVPFVNNSALNRAYEYCDAETMRRHRVCDMPLLTHSKRHPSALMHAFLAKGVAQLLLQHCEQGLPAIPSPSAARYTALATPTCKIGDALRRSAVADTGGGFDWHANADAAGRAPTFVATQAGATLRLDLPSYASEGFLSIGIERSWHNNATVRLRCVAPSCSCPTRHESTFTKKFFTYTQHTKPVWAMMIAAAPGSAAVWRCVVELTVLALSNVSAMRGRAEFHSRVAVKAAVIAPARPGNRSLSTGTMANL